MTPRVAFCTAVTANFAAHARVLVEALRRYHPGVPIVAVVAERDDVAASVDVGDAERVPMGSRFGIPHFPHQAFVCSPHELTVLAKPLALRLLLDRGYDAALFIDSDILVLDQLTPLVDATTTHAVALSPHLLEPLTGDDAAARELGIIRAGTFNGGFIGVSRRPAGLAFLDWWFERLLTHNRMEPWAGLHHDQRWLDLVPPFFGDLGIVRDPGCNVAYWNLGERGLHVVNERVMAGAVPLRFFHFSGFNPAEPMPLSRHARVSGVDGLDVAGDVARQYADRLHAAGWPSVRSITYSYGVFDDGVKVPVTAQQMFMALGEARHRFVDPFAGAASNGASFREWLMAPDERAGQGHGLPRLWRQIYESRGDLQGAFPAPAGADADRFAAWVRGFGVTEHNVDPRLVPAHWMR